MAAIEWNRIADDLRSTTGRELDLVLRPDPDQDCWPEGSSWCDVEVKVDGKGLGSLGRGFPERHEEFLAVLAGVLREDFLDEHIWGGWPICPEHKTHPLEPGISEEGLATWYCPSGTAVARIGALAENE